MAPMQETRKPAPQGPIRAIGLMSGTSMDGIDVAVLDSDGEAITGFGPAATYPYDRQTQARITAILGREDRQAQEVREVERLLTEAHAAAVEQFLARHGEACAGVELVGFHGQTIFHAPDRQVTVQIGDGGLLARRLGLPVVFDFRSADVAAGGQGAPLAPAYHAAFAGLAGQAPLAILNLGGVGNVTLVGSDGSLFAFDTGPANAMVDDWVRARSALAYDEDGRLAAAGRVDEAALAALLAHPYFAQGLPKSLDRNAFSAGPVQGLGLEDGAATLTAFTAATVVLAVPLLPQAPRRWLVCGGGRRNPTLMRMLAERLDRPVEPVEGIGVDGDAVEAQAFAYLAIRVLRGLPLSFPGTTGVPRPMTGGRLVYP